MFYLYAVLYGTMIAEYYYVRYKPLQDGTKQEVKSFLKKRIKHLAAYQTIYDYNMSIDEITNFSKGNGWKAKNTMIKLGIWDENI